MANEETRQMDPTRRQLRVFGVTVTNYEERTAVLLERTAAASTAEERLLAAREIATLTTELNETLRETTNHVLAIQNRVLTSIAQGAEPSP